ncbi:hypothetical protein [Cellulomonas iranensis]|nr:hypothetical protein [Cellulomonas iranensis]
MRPSAARDHLQSCRTEPTYDRMLRLYPDLATMLGLRMATSSWVSPA